MTIAVSIPIDLSSRKEIAETLLAKYGTEYLFLGRIFQETTTNQSCEIEISNAQKDEKFDNNYDGKVVRLISTDVGYEACVTMARFTQVFLQIGGTTVRLESSQLDCEVDKWLAKYNSQDVFDIYSLYVGLIEGEDNYYSCGMHNFGKADVSLEGKEDIGLAIYVMNVFNYYRLTESPILQDEHTFKPDIESPSYTMKWIPDREYESNSLLYNPCGRWHLYRNINLD